MTKDTFPYKECKECEYYREDTDLLGITYKGCGRDIFKLNEQLCPHKENNNGTQELS